MTRHLRAQAGRERFGAAFNISPISVKAGQFLAHIHNSQIHVAAACFRAVIFGGDHQPRSKSRLLKLRIHRQQAEVRAIATPLHIDAAAYNAQVIRYQKAAGLKQLVHRRQVNAVVIDEKAFGLPKSSINHRRDGFCVPHLRDPQPQDFFLQPDLLPGWLVQAAGNREKGIESFPPQTSYETGENAVLGI